MNHETKSFKPLLAIALLVMCATFSAWQYLPERNAETNKTGGEPRDTTKPRKHHHSKDEYRIGDIDEAMKSLDMEMASLDAQLKKLDFSKMEQDMKQAMKEIEKVDFAKIEREVNESLKNVDWKKMQADIDKAMQEVDVHMQELNLEKMHVNLEKMKVNLGKQQLKMSLDAGKIRKQVEEGMEHAKDGLDKAKEELQNLKAFTNELEKDGLINKKKGYFIKVDSGKLYINGKEQSTETYEKYKQYYHKGSFTIKSDGENNTSI